MTHWRYPPPETIPPRSGVRVSASFHIFSRGLISGWDYLRTACSWITVTVWSWELLQNWRSWRLHIDMTWLLWCDFSSQQNCMFSLANYLTLLAVSWLFSDMTCTHRLSLRRLLHSAIYQQPAVPSGGYYVFTVAVLTSAFLLLHVDGFRWNLREVITTNNRWTDYILGEIVPGKEQDARENSNRRQTGAST